MQKIEAIKNYLNTKYIEREEIIEAILVSIVAREHCLLLGPPGTSKSALVMDITDMFTGKKYFQWLLTRFSTPEELFGPLSLKALENDVFRRNTTGKLPEAHFAFLDEAFKAGSAILNSLLTLFNEGLFYNDGAPTKSPLQTVIGASNEFPEEGEGLEALYDRFLLRFEVEYIGEDANFLRMLQGSGGRIKTPEKITAEELESIQMAAAMIMVPDEILHSIIAMRTDLRSEGIVISDRRFKKVLSLIKAKAALDGRAQVKAADLSILRHSLWEKPDQKAKCFEIVDIYSVDLVEKEISRTITITKEVFTAIKKDPNSTELSMEATKKMRGCMDDLKHLLAKFPNRKSDIESAMEKIKTAQERIANVALGI